MSKTVQDIILEEVRILRKNQATMQKDLVILKTEKTIGVAFISIVCSLLVTTLYKFLPAMIK